MGSEQRRRELADFLRTRRMRLSPERVGLTSGRRRRTPGLRREEVAQLANVGVSWYISLEQGLDIHPSKDVLHGIADALQLTSDERYHLFTLADQHLSLETYEPDEQVSPSLQRLLDVLTPVPAFIVGRHWYCLAWNVMADYLFQLSHPASPHDNNIVWRTFINPISIEIHTPKWEQVAQKVLEEFRAETVRYVDEDWFKRLIADLEHASPEFRAWWPRHDVRGIADAQKEMMHPLVGHLMFEHTTLQVPTMPHLKVMIYTPLPETDTLEKLKQLMNTEILTQNVS